MKKLKVMRTSSSRRSSTHHRVPGSSPGRLTVAQLARRGDHDRRADPRDHSIKPMPDLADYMTTEEAAKKLSFHIVHIRRMLREGDLEGLKVGQTWLVSRKSVEKYREATAGMDKRDPRRGNQ